MLDTLLKLKLGIKGIGLVALVGILFGGVLVMVNVPRPVPTVRTLPVTQTAIVSPKEGQWKDLKNIDDALISSCSENFGTISQIFDAQKVLDFDKVASLNVTLAKGADHASALADERKSVLKGLGY